MANDPYTSAGAPTGAGSSSQASMRATLAEAQAAFDAADIWRAESLCRAALTRDPGHPDVLYLLGRIMLRGGQGALARAFLERAIRAEGTRPELYVALGYAYRLMGRFDDAIGALRRGLTLAPDDCEAIHALGHAYQDSGRPDDALEAYQRLTSLEPQRGRGSVDSSLLLVALGRIDDAARLIEDALPSTPSLPSMLLSKVFSLHARGQHDQALALARILSRIEAMRLDVAEIIRQLEEGSPLARLPSEHIADLFDAYAPSFDSHLQDKLRYETPSHIASMLGEVLGRRPADMTALDLGCGTGLCGPALRQYAARLTGVDLSPRMLDRARDRAVYDELIRADLAQYLGSIDEQYDLIVAADVFVYIGDLLQIFIAAKRALRAGGMFVFSVEAQDTPSYALQPAGRYAHSAAYIRGLAQESGLVEVDKRTCSIRLERWRPVEGHIFVLRKE